MIKSLSLTNFKSIGKTLIVNDDDEPIEGKLEFSPLTIFCGKNSSGKSTVLQSILLLAQTLQNNLQSQKLILNGPMVNLGNVDDIKSVFSKSRDISINIEFSISKSVKEQNRFLKFKPLTDCIEEQLILENYPDPFTYYLSNNIEDIDKIIYSIIDKKLNLNNIKWQLNPKLSQKVKDLMNKLNLKYSMTLYTWNGVRYLVVNMQDNSDWYSIVFTEINGNFLNDYELYESFKVTRNAFYLNTKKYDNYQNISLSLCFFSKSPNDISSIIPIIKKIDIKNEFSINNTSFSTYFTAIGKNKPKDIITLDDTYDFFKLNFDDITSTLINNKTYKDNKLVGLYLNHFLPKNLSYVFSNSGFNTDLLINFLEKKFITDEYQYNNKIINAFNESIQIITDDIVKYLNIDVKYFIPDNLILNDKQVFIDHANKIISKLKSMKFKSLFNKALQEKMKINNHNLNRYDDKFQFPYTAISKELGFSIENSVDSINDCFKNKILYIGPLREDPHLQYDYYIDNTKDMGVKGEKCSGILENSKNKLIKYIYPGYFKQDKYKIKIQNISLLDALNQWLKYIEIADSVKTTFFGRFGYVLRIKPFKRDGKDDLTNVGVGVSQILPILLLCLLAEEETTIIIEQPELHLHPAMQSKLTDFFIATMLCNKQLIIETHSEHIINRLRLRAVDCPTENAIKDSFNIYFTENLKDNYKTYKKGNTIFRPLKINEYAAISEWPDGFLDESSITADNIFKLASEKWKNNHKDIK